jgi:hypothetical protein
MTLHTDDIVREAKRRVFEFETWVQTTHFRDLEGFDASSKLSEVFAEAILAERERCAKVASAWKGHPADFPFTGKQVAAAIRQGDDKKEKGNG